jgi:hypothetical protein
MRARLEQNDADIPTPCRCNRCADDLHRDLALSESMCGRSAGDDAASHTPDEGTYLDWHPRRRRAI